MRTTAIPAVPRAYQKGADVHPFCPFTVLVGEFLVVDPGLVDRGGRNALDRPRSPDPLQ